MINVNDIKGTAGHALLIVIAITMAACGGGDKEKKEDGCFWSFLHGTEICLWGNLLNSSPSNQGVEAETDKGGLPSGETSSGLALVNEYEPNNSLDNANVVTLTAESTDSLSGIEINGGVHASDDAADYFILTPNRSSSYDILLCGENCTEIRQSDAVYLMVYDQSQTTIASTPLGGNVTQKLTVNLAAGLAYYIEVNGYNRVDVEYDYRLVITD